MRYYPVGLNIRGRNVLVVGAGPVAERKIRTLLSFGACVKAVAPVATPAIQRLAQGRRISYARREYLSSDMEGKRLVIAATSDRSLNERISKEASKKNILINVVDQASACDFISTAIIKKNGFVVSVSTNGRDPKASKALKGFLKRKIDEFVSHRHKS